jgi:hypothetical protein
MAILLWDYDRIMKIYAREGQHNGEHGVTKMKMISRY